MEIELKLLLAHPDEVLALVVVLGDEQPSVHQHSLYFDGPGQEWSRRKMAVRLRREGASLLLTVKSAGNPRGEYVARGEWEMQLEASRWEELRSGGPPLLAEVGVLLASPAGPGLAAELARTRLVPVGAMDNLRRRCRLPGDGPPLVVEIDETTYPNGQQLYEVELEVDSEHDAEAARQRLQRCFERAEVPWRPSHESKRSRLARVLAGGRA